MQFQFNSDHSVQVTQDLSNSVEAEVRESLDRFADRLTRVEVHVADANAAKGGIDDKHCRMEARIAGLKPLSVSESGATLAQAIRACTATLQRAVERSLGKRESVRNSSPIKAMGEPPR